jgi:hypothetical protein
MKKPQLKRIDLKKLQLTAETVRQLPTAELELVAGGGEKFSKSSAGDC